MIENSLTVSILLLLLFYITQSAHRNSLTSIYNYNQNNYQLSTIIHLQLSSSTHVHPSSFHSTTLSKIVLHHFTDQNINVLINPQTHSINLTYNIKNSQFLSLPFITRKTINLKQHSYTQASLLGKLYSWQQKKQFLQKFTSTIWMSYLSKIKGDSQQSDAGWGCMIKVVQMMFAQVFMRYYHQAQCKDVIKLFSDELQGPFCLSQICRLGNICNFQLIKQEKRFTSAPEIYSIMSSLITQNKSRLNMKLSVENYCSSIKINSQNSYSQEQFPKVISVLCCCCGQFSQSSSQGSENNNSNNNNRQFLEQQYNNHLFSLMREKSFCGIVGGIGNQALYVIGEYDQLAIVLDPHFVQQEDADLTYFEKVPKGVKFTSLKSTFVVNFYFQTKERFCEWVDMVILMDKVWKPWTCFGLDVVDVQGWVKNHRKKSEDFQVLS